MDFKRKLVKWGPLNTWCLCIQPKRQRNSLWSVEGWGIFKSVRSFHSVVTIFNPYDNFGAFWAFFLEIIFLKSLQLLKNYDSSTWITNLKIHSWISVIGKIYFNFYFWKSIYHGKVEDVKWKCIDWPQCFAWYTPLPGGSLDHQVRYQVPGTRYQVPGTYHWLNRLYDVILRDYSPSQAQNIFLDFSSGPGIRISLEILSSY